MLQTCSRICRISQSWLEKVEFLVEVVVLAVGDVIDVVVV